MLLERARRDSDSLLPDELRDILPTSEYEYSETTYERQFFDPTFDDDDDNPDHNTPFDSSGTMPTYVTRGQYELTIELDNNLERTIQHKWKYKEKNMLGRFNPNSMMGKVLSDYHIKFCTQYGVNHSNILKYECYTSVKHNGILYRADPDWKGMGHEWYDWCVARFVSTLAPTNRTVDRTERNGTTGGSKSIARIMGFFRHMDTGVPMFNNVERRDLSWNNILSSGRDSTLYMVLHCETDYFDFGTLVKKFVHQFRMTDIRHMFVLPVDCIVGSLLVVNDVFARIVVPQRQYSHSGEHEVSTDTLLSARPTDKCHWPSDARRYINS
jgi:hypothetical protein